MKKIIMGRTGIEVTELCFGALPIGPIQKNIPLEQAAEIIAHALNSEVSYIDTAQGYKTYPHIKRAMEISGKRPVISSKSPAETYDDMQAAVDEALNKLGLPYIDIFFLHAARTDENVYNIRSGAWQCLKDNKEKGLIRAIGISTHDARVARLSAEREDVDIVFPIINYTGMGILNGTKQDMEAAIELCFKNNKGVVFMKLLAGGNLISEYRAAMDYAVELSKGRAAMALGMLSNAEIDMNIKCLSGNDISGELSEIKVNKKEFFVVRGLCKKCGICVDTCHSDAIKITENSAEIDSSVCLKCGYCFGACPQFCIRMV